MATAQRFPATVGVFGTRAEAERAVAELRAAGYRDDQVGVVGRDAAAAGDNSAEGAAVGAAAGAAATAGLGLAMMPGAIPDIGPVLALGPLAVTLLNVAGGAVGGGLAGALIGAGVPEADAKHYESEVAGGRYLVTVDAGDRAADARAVYDRLGGRYR